MKIASYNIWNSEINFEARLNLLVKVLLELELDIIALQEVKNEEVVKLIAWGIGLKHYCWQPYSDCEEGLAIISKYPMTFNWNNWDKVMDFHNTGVINVSMKIGDVRVGITNVHLDYKRALYREIEIVNAIKKIEDRESNDYEIILGDFNTYPNSSIHNYLIGSQSLYQHCTSWIDLYDSYSIRANYNKAVTIDFYNNPRWDDEYTLDVPGRFDWILLQNPYPKEYPKLVEYKLIGDNRINGITPSDHYGVFCNLNL